MLRAHDQLGPYTIVSHLGSGGMGEVYRARDSRLQREVAIKVLPADFASDAERMHRFEREARAASAINHPNLLAVYDVGTNNGSPYLVSELLEGQTLRERLLAGRISARKALEIGLAVAQGMAAAHERGIIHRDLKPENIFLTSDGHVKILDFGLAKVATPATADSETLHDSTREGVSLGTPGYMSPEQVRGQAVDARSDVFSFGAVLFEMLTGERAFKGSTMADVASAVLREEPDWTQTAAHGVPGELERMVQHCLEKSPAARFQSARDLAFQLQGLAAPSSSSSRSAGEWEVPARWNRRKTLAAIVLAALVVGAIVWVLRGAIGEHKQPAAHVVEYERVTDFAGLEDSPAISPDGRSVAFSADVSGTKQIWVRLLNGGPPLQITKDAGVHLEPRWSPDSSSIYYFVPPGENDEQGTIWQVPALGGHPRRLNSAMTATDVGRQTGRLAFFRLNQKKAELVITEADGTNANPILDLGLDFTYLHPRWSPDEKVIAYEQATDFWAMDIFSVAASGGQPRKITNLQDLINGLTWAPDSSSIVFSTSTGATLLYLPNMQLWQIAVEGGEPHRLTFGDINYEMPDMSKDGHLVASARRMQYDIWKFPVGGDAKENVAKAQRITHQTGKVLTPSLSPDDRQMVYLSDSGGRGNLWVMDLATGESSEITSLKGEATVGIPLWSPDGKNIAFAITGNNRSWRDVDYWLVNPDGSNQRRAVTNGSWATWSPDGQSLYYLNVAARSVSHSPVGEVMDPGAYKIKIEGGSPVLVRKDRTIGITPAPDGGGIYFVKQQRGDNGTPNYLLCVARPETAEARTLLRMSNTQVPIWQGPHPAVSPDGKNLAVLLNDDLGTNIWLVSTKDGALKRVTDFGDRRTYIARRVSWTHDGKYIFAAVGEGDSDIVSFSGLLQ